MVLKESKDMLAIVLVIGLVLVSLLLAYNYTVKEVNLVAQEERDTITVSGTTKQVVAPDKAEVYVRIRSDAVTSREAQALGAQRATHVVEALKRAGLAEKMIENVQYALQRDEQYDPETRENKVKGYTLVQVLKLNVEEVKNVGHFVDVSVQAGANAIDNIVFTLTKAKEAVVRKEALGSAAREAKQKAEVLASSLGVGLKKLVSVSEGGFYFASVQRSSGTVALAAEKAVSEVPPQGIEVSATVNVVYEI